MDPYAPPGAAQPTAADLPPPGQLRIDGAFGRAFEVVKRFLFRPFDFGKWFVYGFIVWLAELGDGSNLPSSNPLSNGSGGSGTSGRAMQELFAQAREWLRDNLGLVIAIAIGTLVVTAGFAILFAWLSSRGHMMALRAVALDHSRLGEHWRETREAAWSYLGFRLLIGAIEAPIIIGVVVWTVIAVIDVADLATTDPMLYLRALIGPILVVVLMTLVTAPIRFVGRNLLAPMLLKFGDGLGANWRRTMTVVRTSFGGVIVFLLVRILIAVVQGIGEILVVYATCCIGALPVIHQVFAAPFTIFERAYTLAVLESLGPEYKLLLDPAPWPPPYAPMPPYPQNPQQQPPGPPYSPPGYGPP